MIKKLLIFIIAFGALFGIVYGVQNAVIDHFDHEVRYNMYDTTMFFMVSSLIICVHFEIFSAIKTLQPQLGFIYLPTLFIKGILFFLVFRSSLFDLEALTTHERLYVLLPLVISLGLEVFFIIQILNRNSSNS